MDKDRVVGSAKEIKGAFKQAIGKAVDDAKLQSDGKADKIAGRGTVLSCWDVWRQWLSQERYSMEHRTVGLDVLAATRPGRHLRPLAGRRQ